MTRRQQFQVKSKEADQAEPEKGDGGEVDDEEPGTLKKPAAKGRKRTAQTGQPKAKAKSRGRKAKKDDEDAEAKEQEEDKGEEQDETEEKEKEEGEGMGEEEAEKPMPKPKRSARKQPAVKDAKQTAKSGAKPKRQPKAKAAKDTTGHVEGSEPAVEPPRAAKTRKTGKQPEGGKGAEQEPEQIEGEDAKKDVETEGNEVEDKEDKDEKKDDEVSKKPSRKRVSTDSDKSEVKKKTKGTSATFARRRLPNTEIGAAKFINVKKVFEEDIKPLLTHYSQHEDKVLTNVFLPFLPVILKLFSKSRYVTNQLENTLWGFINFVLRFWFPNKKLYKCEITKCTVCFFFYVPVLIWAIGLKYFLKRGAIDIISTFFFWILSPKTNQDLGLHPG